MGDDGAYADVRVLGRSGPVGPHVIIRLGRWS